MKKPLILALAYWGSAVIIGSLIGLAAIASLSQPAHAQIPQISPTELEPHWGFARLGPCAAGNADLCGSNPPTFQLTAAHCGMLFSTSNARNSDNSVSTAGVRFILPTVAALTAAGYTPSGAAGSEFYNRQGQCELYFVMGLPLPQNYLRIGINGVQNTDKVTFSYPGTFHDMFSGDVVFPPLGSAVIGIGWNGTSWIAKSGMPSMMERLGYGQMAAHGQGRLFYVTSDPSWWTVGSKIGSLAYCQNNGFGTSTPDNGGIKLSLIPSNCIFLDKPIDTTLTVWVGMRHFGSAVVTAISAGDAYGAGTAPNGAAYGAGNYAVLTGSFTSLVSGDTVLVDNLPTTLGSVLNGKWIAKGLNLAGGVYTAIELHESVNDSNISATSQVGPPSSFTAGDTILAGVANPVSVSYEALAETSSTISPSRMTNPAIGVEMDAGNNLRAIVGMAKRTAGTGYQDTITNRMVASWFNPRETPCINHFTTDRTFTATTFAKINAEIDCNFVYINGISSTALALGDVGRPVKYSAMVQASNGTNGDGCEFAVGFDETVTNGGFTGDATGWTLDAGWSYSANHVVATASSDNLSQTLTLAPGTKYSLTYTATQSLGSVRPSLGGTLGTSQNTSATFSEVITAGTTDSVLKFVGTGFTGTIDTVSLIPISEIQGFTNPAGANGSLNLVTIVGQRTRGLTESNHSISLYGRAVTGGTCTVKLAPSSIQATIWQ